jgi:orotate phosphoribosyltransferase
LTILDLVAGRRGHFRLESGHHGPRWLDLDSLFVDPVRIAPFVETLAERLRPFNASIICGPLIGGAFLAQLVAVRMGVRFCFTERFVESSSTDLYPVRYSLPPSLRSQIKGARVAIVDDIMSAGSALRGTQRDLQEHGATTVVAGALLVLGTIGADHFTHAEIPVVALAHEPYEIWAPDVCPLCAAGEPLEKPVG